MCIRDRDGIIIFRQNSICLFIVKVGLIWAFLQFIVMIMLLLCQPNIVDVYKRQHLMDMKGMETINYGSAVPKVCMYMII